jgi:hypothetical protein
MLKYYCDICGTEVEPPGKRTTRFYNATIKKQGDPEPKTVVISIPPISVVLSKIEQNPFVPYSQTQENSRVACDDCIREALISALNLPVKPMEGGSGEGDLKLNTRLVRVGALQDAADTLTKIANIYTEGSPRTDNEGRSRDRALVPGMRHAVERLRSLAANES